MSPVVAAIAMFFHADISAADCAGAVVAADRLLKEARQVVQDDARARDLFTRAGWAYDDLHERSQSGAGCGLRDEHLFLSGEAFAAAHAPWRALRAFLRIASQYPQSSFAVEATRRSAWLHVELGNHEGAASALWRFARMFPKDPGASEASAGALRLRVAVGETEYVLADLAVHRASFGASDPVTTALLAIDIAEELERRGERKLAAGVVASTKIGAPPAPLDVLLRATALLARVARAEGHPRAHSLNDLILTLWEHEGPSPGHDVLEDIETRQ